MMKYSTILMKFMMLLACSIVVMHSVVPHHHHDCDTHRHGLMFEDEVDCCCTEPHRHNTPEHPSGMCNLKEMLSQVVVVEQQNTCKVVMSIVADQLESLPLSYVAVRCPETRDFAAWHEEGPPERWGKLYDRRGPPIC